MPIRTLLLWLLYCLSPLSVLAAPQLYTRGVEAGAPASLAVADLRWLWEKRQLNLGVIGRDNPPFDMLGTGHAYEGISAEYASLLGEKLGLEVRLKVFDTYSAAFAALRAGAVDMVSSVSAEQAQAADLHVSTPYIIDQPLLLASERGVSGGSEGTRLLMVDGYRPLPLLQREHPNARILLHPTPYSALAALQLGEAELYLGSGLGTRYLLARGQLPGIEAVEWPDLPAQALGFAMLDNEGPLPRLVDAVLQGLDEQQHARIRGYWSPQLASPGKLVRVELTEAQQRWLATNPVVKVLLGEQQLPLSYRDGHGQLRGLSLDVLDRISRLTGLRFEVQAGSDAQRMIEQVRGGQADLVAGLAYSPAHARQLRFSRAYLSAAQVLVTRNEAVAPGSLEPFDRQVLALDQARSLVARHSPGRLRITASLALPPVHFAFAGSHADEQLLGIVDKALLALPPAEMEAMVRRWRNPTIVDDGFLHRYGGRVLAGFATTCSLLLLALLWVRYLRRMQVQLRRAKRDADAANQAKTQFLAAMSHEIRTPLHALLGMLELARRKAGQGELDHLAIEVAADAAMGLQELIGDVLDITRIETGQLQLVLVPVSLREQVARVVQLFEQQAHGKGLALNVVCKGAVNSWVMLDPVRFKQVLANLVNNAIKFTPQGEVLVSLSMQAAAGRASVLLEVADTGIGIAQSELASLGQPFHQASNQRQSPRSSTGLGLGISRSLCEMLGGQLRLHSVLGQGTRIEIRLDLMLAAAPVVAASVLPQGDPARLAGLRVLVVDDYPANRLLLAHQLEFLGHEVQVAEDGDQALRLWLRHPFDVVISDCNMPRLGGFALARAIREHERRRGLPRCRVVGLTASAMQAERRRARAAGMDHCLFKPLDLDTLKQTLRACQPTGQGPPIVDLAHLHKLVCGDQAVLVALMADLAKSNREDLTKLAASLHQPSALAELAHRVKGAARIAPGHALIALCERLEAQCGHSPPDPLQVRRAALALKDAMLRLDRWLASYLAQHADLPGTPPPGGMAHIMPNSSSTSRMTSTTPTIPDGP
ncbi:transporter substrate-binding domain-containing protein [Pseudomonas sp. NPDC089547]|uniref:transporter substrate-binding domain-containing protein n=1 Tax=Pseudomonas sp. NPDC089547 TaxID=3390652 RepID=UPI003D0107BB